MKLATAIDRARFISFVQRQDLPLEVDCKPWKKSRSNEQNNLLFGVLYPPIAEAMGYDAADIHQYALGTFFGWVDRRVPKTPNNSRGLESVPYRSTTRDENGRRNVLDVKKFNEFVAHVERIAAKAGVFVQKECA